MDTLVGKGPEVLPALRRYMKAADSLHYPLMVMDRVTDSETAFESSTSCWPTKNLATPETPSGALTFWPTSPSSRMPRTPTPPARAIPYLADFDENVRYKAVDCIGLKPDAAATESLITALIREEEESRRLQVRIGEVLAENQWDLGERKSEVSELLEESNPLESFKMHHDKLVQKG